MSVDPGVLAHNRKVLDTLEEGDLIQIQRGIYSHWATYIGIILILGFCFNDPTISFRFR